MPFYGDTPGKGGDSGNPLWNIVGDPAGYATGTNTEGFGGVKKMLFGDPDAIKKAYDEAMGRSERMGKETRDFLLDRERQAQAFFGPIQHMYQNAYGTEGIQGPQIPQAVGPLAKMGGGY